MVTDWLSVVLKTSIYLDLLSLRRHLSLAAIPLHSPIQTDPFEKLPRSSFVCGDLEG